MGAQVGLSSHLSSTSVVRSTDRAMDEKDRGSSDDQSTSFKARTVVLGLGVGALGLAVGPVAGVVGAAAMLLRSRTMSMSSAFDEELDRTLREDAELGRKFTRVERFSKSIDRCCCSTSDAQEVSGKTDLPMLRHSGLLLKFDAERWLKLEFAQESLQYTFATRRPALARTFLVEACELRKVSPVHLADCLKSSKHMTYNSFTWNCNHVTDMLWEKLLLCNADEAARDKARDEAEGDACTICYSSPKQICFSPCGHYQMCGTCASRFSACPFCQEVIIERIRVFG